jgi:hypothetical protein
MHAFPRAILEATSPSSHAAIGSSILSNFLSRVRSYSCSLIATTDVIAVVGGKEGIHQPTSDDQPHDKKQA